MPTPQTPTLETDALYESFGVKGNTDFEVYDKVKDFARKLERERDEARKNATIVGLERDKFTEQIANLQRLNDNQRIQLANLQNECALNNNAAQTWDRLSLEAELTQLRKVCDELAECLEAASQLLIDEGYRSHKHDCNTVLKAYSTLPHVIKAKGK